MSHENPIKRDGARLSSRRKSISVALGVFSFCAGATTVGLAAFSFYVNSFKHVLLLSYVGLVYVLLASLWGAAGWGIIKLHRWGWFFGLLASLAAILNGAYRLSQTPTLGELGLYDIGLWFTATLGGILPAGLLLSVVWKEKSARP